MVFFLGNKVGDMVLILIVVCFILDFIGMCFEEFCEMLCYLIGFFVFFGLFGIFWGLL